MSNCLFPWCMPKSLEFLVEDPSSNVNSNEEHDRYRRKKSSPLLKVDGDGLLQVPTYRRLRREQSQLLSCCWEQDWNQVLLRCHSYPEEAYHMTTHSGRTALHLATFNHACPLKVAQALLRANRHMVLVQDANWYTPLHNVAFFPGESLVKIVCDTAIMVEQELQGRSIPPTSGTSPLFLAAKRAAPLRTLRQLLDTRQRTEWIAPSTGGEPYWMDTLDEYSSPLEILLRDRSVGTWDLHKRKPCRDPPSSGNEEEDLVFVHPPASRILTPRLLWQMKLTGNERLRASRAEDGLGDDGVTDTSELTTKDIQIPSLDDRDDITTEEEMQALSLWTKCVELFNEHVPRLLLRNEDDNPTAIPTSIQSFSKDRFAVVHCVASAKVPLPNLLQVALMVFPEQALMRDEYGMLPVHHVLSAKHPYATKTLVSMLISHSPQAALYLCPYHPTVAENNNNSASTSDTATATTPLGLALELGLPLDILKELLWADSDVTLTTMDPSTGLYPFAVAASKGYELDVVYTLLNAHPQVLNHHSKQHVRTSRLA